MAKKSQTLSFAQHHHQSMSCMYEIHIMTGIGRAMFVVLSVVQLASPCVSDLTHGLMDIPDMWSDMWSHVHLITRLHTQIKFCHNMTQQHYIGTMRTCLISAPCIKSETSKNNHTSDTHTCTLHPHTCTHVHARHTHSTHIHTYTRHTHTYIKQNSKQALVN